MSEKALIIKKDSVVAVIAPNWVGDSLFFLPALAALKRCYPGIRLLLLAKPGICHLHSANSLFEKTVSFVSGSRLGRMKSAALIRESKPDLTLVFPDSFSSALTAWVTGARQRLGRKGQLRSFLLTHCIEKQGPRGERRVYQEYGDLVRPFGVEIREEDLAFRLPVQEKVFLQMKAVLSELSTESNFVSLCPTSAFGSSKEWPLVSFYPSGRRTEIQRIYSAVSLCSG